MSKEYNEFNCDEDHEITYVANQYKDKPTQSVKDFLKEKCNSNEINNSTHDEVYELLKKNGFEKE